MRFIVAAITSLTLVGCGPPKQREAHVDHTPSKTGEIMAASSSPARPSPPVTVDAAGFPVGDAGSERGLRGILGGQEVMFRHIRLVYTANNRVQLRAQSGDASLLLPIVLDPAEARCIERPLGRGVGTGRLALDGQRYSARFAYRLRIAKMQRRPYDTTARPTIDGQEVGTLSGTLIAVFKAGPHSPLSGWLVGNLEQAPVVQLGDPGREQHCTPRGHTGPIMGTFNGVSMDFRVVGLTHFPHSDDRHPAGFELQLAATRKSPSLQVRFQSVPQPGSCTERRAAHEVDPGGSGGEVPRFRLEVSQYEAPADGKDGTVSGYVRAEFRPDTIVEGTFENAPTVVRSGPEGPRVCDTDSPP